MRILELPVELIANIAAHVDDDVDLFNARLSHRAIERACLSLFGLRHFRKRGFLVLRPALDVLQSIADHPELRKYVQHIWFNPDCYTSTMPDCCHGDLSGSSDEGTDDEQDSVSRALTAADISAMPEGRHRQRQFYELYKRDHERLMHTRELELSLRRALKNLPNLLTVGMRRSEDYPPWGWRILKDQIGQDPRAINTIPYSAETKLAGPTRLFIATVAALASADRKLERLYTDAIELENIPIKVLSQQTMTAALSSVRYVELNIVKGWLTRRFLHDSDGSDAGDSDASDFDRLKKSHNYGQGLVRFFKAMPNLLELGLQIFPGQRQSHLVAPTARDPHSWRKSYAFMAFSRLAAEVSLPHLTRIKLEKLTTSSKILSDFLRPCSPSLTSLKLRDIRLLPAKDEPRPWETFFAFLATQCSQLDYILFYHLMHDQGGISYTEDPPAAPPAETDADDFIEDPIWPAHAGQAMFAKYNHITMEVNGRDEVKLKLEEIAVKHWYHRPLFSYAMDEDMWHTDTSDEEW